MLTRFSDFDRLFGWGWPEFDRAFELLDAMRRDFDRSWATPGTLSEGWLPSDMWDTGEALVFRADVPGLTEKDLQISLNQDILTLSGTREVSMPKGYTLHRRERPELRFSRSFRLPYRVEAEKADARVEQGVLTVTLPKAAEAKPRRISVRAE